ncbi:MAG: GYD domain-containing protein [Proteobacteria bacterium]|nr:GYD domain-containing protein [Pseudomonadota bacterium]
MIQITYSDDALAELMRHPQDRGAVLSDLFDRLGGKIEAFYHALGEFDLVVIAELPDNESMAAILLAIRSTGVAKTQNVTTLLSRDEAVNALRRAGGSGYEPPG